MVRLSPQRPGEAGYNLVVLVMAITVLNILVAVALPMWSHRIRRDKEEEAIFRGLQYAEAIRVFQQRFGRYPATLEELVEVEPRSIRRLWHDPLSEHGEFGLVVEAPRTRPEQAARADPSTQSDAAALGSAVEVRSQRLERPSLGGVGRTVSLVKLPRGDDGEERQAVEGAAIHGVYLDHEGESIRLFLDHDQYDKWVFTAELIPVPQVRPDGPLPRVRSDWIGKPFPQGLAARLPQAPAPGSADGGSEVGGAAGPSRKPGVGQRQDAGEGPSSALREEREDEKGGRFDARLERLRDRSPLRRR